MEREKAIVMDLDGCVCEAKREGLEYADLRPVAAVIERLREYRRNGFTVILFTSRNMNTYDSNLGRINARTARGVLDWLDRHEIPYDEIHFGKPWCGTRGFYVDDRAVRPSEFVSMEFEDIRRLLGAEERAVLGMVRPEGAGVPDGVKGAAR
jgi:capsule biosynthesis phosphatase